MAILIPFNVYSKNLTPFNDLYLRIMSSSDIKSPIFALLKESAGRAPKPGKPGITAFPGFECLSLNSIGNG